MYYVYTEGEVVHHCGKRSAALTARDFFADELRFSLTARDFAADEGWRLQMYRVYFKAAITHICGKRSVAKDMKKRHPE